MSPGGRSEQVGALRDAIARIEAAGGPRLAADPRDVRAERVTLGRRLSPGQSIASGQGIASGRRLALDEGLALDGVLGGRSEGSSGGPSRALGLERAALHEVVAASPGDAGAASGFALALAARFAACGAAGRGRALVWIVEEGAERETGRPYAPGLAAHGIDPARLVLVRTASGADTLWAMEEALKCRGLAAVVTDLWRTKLYDLVASRRLALAAQKSRTPGILVPAGAPGTAALISSAARTRFEISTAPGQAIASAGHRVPLPGRATWQVRLARIRAGPDGEGFGSFDGDRLWPVAWDHAEARFCDALPFPSPALPRDRPHQQADRGRHAA